MLKKITLTALAAATALSAFPAAAEARPYDGYRNSYYGDGHYGRDRHRGDYGRGAYYGRGSYYGGGAYRGGYDRRYYGRNQGYYRYGGRCRSDGTTGTIIGAIAGGLLGHEIAQGGRYRRGDGTTGAIVGGAVGALAGRAIDRNC